MATNEGAQGQLPINQQSRSQAFSQHASSEPQGDIHMAMDAAHHEAMVKQEELPSAHMDVDMETAAEAALSSMHANHADSPMEQASSTIAPAHAPLSFIKQEAAVETFIEQETMEETPIKQEAMEETPVKQETVEERLDAALEGNDDKTGGYESSDLESSDDDNDGP